MLKGTGRRCLNRSGCEGLDWRSYMLISSDQTRGEGKQPCPQELELAGGMRLSRWCAITGINPRTARRYRLAGKLKVIVRYGQAYVTPQAIAEFFVDDGSET